MPIYRRQLIGDLWDIAEGKDKTRMTRPLLDALQERARQNEKIRACPTCGGCGCDPHSTGPTYRCDTCAGIGWVVVEAQLNEHVIAWHLAGRV